MNRFLKFRHPRLAAFFDSSILNGIFIFYSLVWFLLGLYPEVNEAMVIIMLILLLGLVSFSLWFWIKKPSTILVNESLSNITSPLILYLLIVSAMKTAGKWWYIFGMISAICAIWFLVKRDNNKITHLD